jgi:hypothetical protein
MIGGSHFPTPCGAPSFSRHEHDAPIGRQQLLTDVRVLPEAESTKAADARNFPPKGNTTGMAEA